MFYELIVCFAKMYLNSFRCHTNSCVLWLLHFLKESKPTFAIHGGCIDTDSSRAPGITSDLYGPMNVNRGAVISVIVAVNLFFCILHLNAFYGSATL